MYPRLQPPAAPPRRPCLGGRSLILRSLRPAASGSANIINVIVSRVALKVLAEHRLQETGGDGPGGCRPTRAVPETTPVQNSFHHAPTHGRLWHAPCGGTDRANSTLPAVETNRRPHPVITQHSLLAKTKRHPRPPFIGKQKARGSVHDHAPPRFLFFIARIFLFNSFHIHS